MPNTNSVTTNSVCTKQSILPENNVPNLCIFIIF